jgi:hypothetical protein
MVSALGRVEIVIVATAVKVGSFPQRDSAARAKAISQHRTWDSESFAFSAPVQTICREINHTTLMHRKWALQGRRRRHDAWN